jgi:hypothetical protein
MTKRHPMLSWLFPQVAHLPTSIAYEGNSFAVRTSPQPSCPPIAGEPNEENDDRSTEYDIESRVVRL